MKHLVKHEKNPWKGLLNRALVLSVIADKFGCRYAVCAQGWQHFYKQRVHTGLQTLLSSGAEHVKT